MASQRASPSSQLIWASFGLPLLACGGLSASDAFHTGTGGQTGASGSSASSGAPNGGTVSSSGAPGAGGVSSGGSVSSSGATSIGGAHSSGGAASGGSSHAGSAGAIGGTGGGSGGGSAGNASCSSLLELAATQLQAAQACNASLNRLTCQDSVLTPCGCPVPIDLAGSPIAQAYLATLAEINRRTDCQRVCPAVLCIAPGPGHCVTQGGSIFGVCMPGGFL
jgi:hypothetical protein